jgi:hypothetical protein
MKYVLLIVYSLLSFYVAMAQKTGDYVVLVHLHPSFPGDTIYGEVLLKNTTNCNVKIKLLNGKSETYDAQKVKYFKANQDFFASIPYLDANVFAKRIQEGAIDLYFFDCKVQGGGVVGGALGGAIGAAIGGALGGMSSTALPRHFLKLKNQCDFIEIPHGSRKIKKTMEPIFANDKELQDKLMAKDFKEDQLSDLIKTFNSKMTK